MMGKTRIEELCYELYGSSKQQDSWQRYAMVRELRDLMKQPKGGSDHLERSLDDGELVETEAATELIESEDRAVKDEVNATMISAIDKEEPIPQSKVPVSDSEIVRSIELEEENSVLKNEDYVVLNENLEQEWDQKNTKEITEVDGVVERDQKTISSTKICCAHKVFGKMSQHQERLGIKKKKKGKSWMFKYKKGNKQRDLLLLNGKDSLALRVIGTGLETVERVVVGDVERDQKMISDFETSWAHKVFVKMPSKESFGDDRTRKVIAELHSYTGLTHLDKSDFRRFDGDKIKEWLFKVEEFFSIDFTPMELKVKLASNHLEGQLLRQFQELFEKLSLASMMFEQTFSSITEPRKILLSFFSLKHKWRSRLSHSFSEMNQRMIGRVWKSFGYLMEDIMEEDQKQPGDGEPLVIVLDVDAKVELVWEGNSFIFHFKTRVWDPGRSLIKDATPRELPFHSTATISFSLLLFLSRITCNFLLYKP